MTKRELIINIMDNYTKQHGNGSETELNDIFVLVANAIPSCNYNQLIQKYIEFKLGNIEPKQTKAYNKKNK
jgi:hypothetical protein